MKFGETFGKSLIHDYNPLAEDETVPVVLTRNESDNSSGNDSEISMSEMF